MGYCYETEKPWLFTDEGQRCLLKARDGAGRLLRESGAFVGFCALKDVHYGDTWKAMALIDRLVELGYLREVTGPQTRGQDRVFVAGDAS